ncbi:MAG: Mut7-C RNAse domain-containing protein [Candidatus Angelobacter sp.]
MNAEFRFYGPLNDFLPPQPCSALFTHSFLLPGSVKDMIEAFGVPHTEVDLILANGHSVDFSYRVQDGDRIAVYPAFFVIDISALSGVQRAPDRFWFVLDGHLGSLAGYLRILGFDALYRNDWDDEELARISAQEGRILLTRDRGLLKRGSVTYGYFIRATAPRRQLQEVIRRYGLRPLVQPFVRCIRCNGLLRAIDKESVRSRLPERIAKHFVEFTMCDSCGRVYWQGSHFHHMKRFLGEVMQSV